jgi:hypothetical protein|uniref:Uncharacterized protein n=1 Tax=Sipha flava TaxID=143950 RepID=A0A2S2QW10_9HEMI
MYIIIIILNYINVIIGYLLVNSCTISSGIFSLFRFLKHNRPLLKIKINRDALQMKSVQSIYDSTTTYKRTLRHNTMNRSLCGLGGFFDINLFLNIHIKLYS